MAFPDDSVTPGKTNLAPFFSPLFVNPEPVRGVMVINVAASSVAGPFFPPILGRGTPIDTLWVSMMSEGEWFIIWGSQAPGTTLTAFFDPIAPNPNIPPDPDPTAHVLATNASLQCIRVPADFEYQRKVVIGDAFKIRNNSLSPIQVRIEVVSPIPG